MLLSYYDQRIDITGRFEEGVAHVTLETPDGGWSYLTIHADGSYVSLPEGYPDADTLG